MSVHPVVVTDADFGQAIEQHEGLAMVDFWATWCGPCQIVAPVVEQLAEEYEGKLKVGKLDVDSNQQTALKFNVRSIPSILFFKGGEHVDTVVGAVPKAYLVEKVEQHLG
ncbi:MAG: thioredoxin [Gemmatimonadota bacterium]